MRTYPLLTLIADDCDDDRLLFSRAVRSLPGFGLAGVTMDGLETVMYLRGDGQYGNRERYPFPDVVLLDHQMPGYNGVQVLACTRNIASRPKVVLWTDAIELVNQRLAYEFGATVVCEKPAATSRIQATLKAMAGDWSSSPIAGSRWSNRCNYAGRVSGSANWLASAQCGV